MQYPLISEYIESIRSAEDNFASLTNLRPIFDESRNPVMSSGNFAVVFKMTDGKKDYAVKCFTKEQEGRADAYQLIAEELESVNSLYITSIKYLEKELFVDCSCADNEFPVLLMDWIEGESMERYIADNYQDSYAMSMLCYRFCKMAAWLRSQQFAHGDLKPDNIIIRPDGELTLVDYDGMFVPAMKGQKSPTVGTKNFSHPLRTVDDFDETIDDLALASIALSLKAISLNPSLYSEYCVADRLLFTSEDYFDIGKSKVLTEVQSLLTDNEVAKLLSLFLLAISTKDLSMSSFRLFNVSKPKEVLVISTKVTKEELDNAIEDEFGGIYSKDGKKLLYAPTSLKGSYRIREGTKIVSDNAFIYRSALEAIEIPDSVTDIGNSAFSCCSSLASIEIPHRVTSIGIKAFSSCLALKNIEIPDSVTSMNGNPFVDWHGTLKIQSPNFCYENGMLLDIRHNALIAYCSNSPVCSIPDGVMHIGNRAFCCCSSLKTIVIPNSVNTIEESAFAGCSFLESIEIPNSVNTIGTYAFAHCSSLKTIVIPDSVTSIGKSAFSGCSSLESIEIPYYMTNIGESVFEGCVSINSEKKKEIVKRFGNRVFTRTFSHSSILENLSKYCKMQREPGHNGES